MDRWRLGPFRDQVDALSTAYVQVPVILTTPTGPGDPSVGTVTLAFLASTGKPQVSDWKSGSWQSTAIGGWLAQCLIGPSGGALTLTPGMYYVWAKVVDGAETVIEQVGTLEVT
ncbi:hypothetical protein [Streptomyces mirabilis]|uniref:hypothetical protein n=1 Tax=Streptomyces mirabilis TaxID=68239 RepID=UPI0036D7662C